MAMIMRTPTMNLSTMMTTLALLLIAGELVSGFTSLKTSWTVPSSKRIRNTKVTPLQRPIVSHVFLEASASSVQQLEDILLPIIQHRTELDHPDVELSLEEETTVRSALMDLANGPTNRNSTDDEISPISNSNNNSLANDDNDMDSMWRPLLGNYQVLYTLPSNANERPVGGKWSRNPFLRITGSWQHLVPPSNPNNSNSNSTKIVAQAINLLHIRALGLWRISVLLRGDAVPLSSQERQTISRERNTPYGGLSPRTLRADFDPPKIIVSSLQKPHRTLACVSLGPVSSVVLDTPYSNSLLRIGKGSRGSVFAFGRTRDAWVEEEWRRLVTLQAWKKSVVATASSVITISLAWLGARILRAWWQRCLLIPWILASLLSTWMVTMGTGGIERDPPTEYEEEENNDLKNESSSTTSTEA